MKRFSLLLGAATLAFTVPSTVLAQEVIMRRPLPVPTEGAEWRTSPFIIYDQFGNVVQPQNACGPYEQRRDVDCVQRGEVVGDYYCREAGPKPEESKNEFLDAGCSYTWYQGGFEDPGPSCSNAERQEQTVECRRDFDGAAVDDSLCSGNKPDTERTVVDHSTCTYSWNDEDPFADPGPNCTASEEWTKNVFCERDLDKQPVDDSLCTQSRPADTDIREDYSSCTYSWDSEEDYVDPGASCTAAETQTRAVWCKRDLDGNVEDDSLCDPTKRPASSQIVEDFSDCEYDPTNWSDWEYDSTCSTSTTRTREAECLRSDGTIVPDGECTSRSVDLTETENGVQNLSTCGYVAANWTGPANPTCSAASTKTEEAECRRSDGAIVDDAECTSRGVSLTRITDTPADYSSCSYEAVNWTGWTYDSTCSSSTTRTRTAQCRRSDGTIVPGSQCSSRGVAVTETQNGVTNTNSCTYEWRESGFGPWTSTCSNSATRSQSVNCRRSDGTILTGSQESLCTTNDGPKPAAQEGPMGIYSTCGYTPNYGAWSACDGTSHSRTMSTCRRDTGDNVALSNCTSRGHDLTETESCRTYAWKADGFGSWNNTCSSNATRPVIYKCESSAGGFVADSFCSGNKPTGSESSAIYSGCSYTAVNWTNPANPTCSAANTETQTADCRRGDGTIVSDSNCTSRGVSLTRTANNGADYSGCSYSAVNWTGWNYASTCSTNTTRTRTADCRRSDGTIVGDTSCTSRGVSLSETQTGQTNTSGCGYEWRYGAWQDPGASCTPAERQTRTETCRRDDGANVNVSFCSGVSGRQSTTRDVEDFSGCNPGVTLKVDWGSYSPWSSTCSTSATRTRTGTCKANGVAVAASVCTSRGLAVSETQTRAQYSTCNYTPTYGAWGNCSANGTQTASMTACTRIVPQGNQSVSLSKCTSRGHLNPRSQNCTPPQTEGRTCSGGTLIGRYSGSGWGNDSNPTNVGTVSGVFSGMTVNSSYSSINSQVRTRCRSGGGTCLAYDHSSLSEYGNVQSYQVSYSCYSSPSSPTGTPYKEHDYSGGSYEVWETNSRIP